MFVIDVEVVAYVKSFLSLFNSASPSRRSLVMLPRHSLTTSTSIRRAISTSLRAGFESVQSARYTAAGVNWLWRPSFPTRPFVDYSHHGRAGTQSRLVPQYAPWPF